MKREIRLILDGMQESGIIDVPGCLNFLEGWYRAVTWSLEKDEFQRMTKREKRILAKHLINQLKSHNSTTR